MNKIKIIACLQKSIKVLIITLLTALGVNWEICTARRRMRNYRKGSRSFRANKNSNDSISGGNKGGCNLKQSAVVQNGRWRGPAPLRLLIWRVAPPCGPPGAAPRPTAPCRWGDHPRLAESRTTRILIANLPDNVQIDNGIILSLITNYETL